MGENRYAVRAFYEGDRLYGRYFFTGNKTGGMVANVACKCFFHAARITMLCQKACVMRSGDNGIGKCVFQGFICDVDAVRLQQEAHFSLRSSLEATKEVI